MRDQLKLEEKENIKKIVNDLGFKEEKDYDGKSVLKNRIPIKQNLSLKEVDKLLGKLKYSKCNKNHSKIKI